MAKRKNAPKYGPELADFIATKVASGLTMDDVCRRFPDKLPTATTIHRWQREHPDFKEMIVNAYQSFFMVKIDELEHLSTAPIEELFPNYFKGDNKDGYKLAFEARRARIDALKFMTGKLAGRLTPAFRDKQEIETNSEVTFNIVTYSEPKQVKGKVIEGEKKDD